MQDSVCLSVSVNEITGLKHDGLNDIPNDGLNDIPNEVGGAS